MTATRITTPRPMRFRPDSGVLRDLAWRAALVVVATVAILAELPAWVRAPLSIVAMIATIGFFLRRYRRHGLLDAVLIAVGGAVAMLVIVGLVLNAFPSGLSAGTWAVGVGVLELIALFTLAYRYEPVARLWPSSPRLPVAGLVWTVLVGGVLAGSLVWAVDSFDSTYIEPLALAGVPSGDSTVVTVSSGADSGPYQLDLVSDGERTVLAEDIEVGADDPTSITVPLQPNQRVTVQLVRPGSTTPVRQLILDTVGETSVTE